MSVPRKLPNDMLDDLVKEAREDMTPPEIDWDRVERRLEQRIANEDIAPRVAHARAPGAYGRILAFGLAAAAAAVLVVGRDRDGAPLGGATASTQEAASGGTLRVTEGAGDVRVSGVVAESGLGLRGGDLVEVSEARAVFDRPRKVTWLLEGEAGPGRGRARVTSASEPIVLSLEEGAIEAQVARSDAPESFAVDVSSGGRTVRVAVHGTHLRVVRAGTKVVVDLSEGVVSIGVPPRVGPTYGALVTAPAHVELEIADPVGTLRVDHDRASVRAPIALGPGDLSTMLAREPMPSPGAPRPTTSPVLAAPAAATSGAPHKPDAVVAAPQPAAASAADVEKAVRDCVVTVRKTRPEVKVTVSSTLRLRVSPSGDVQSAVFDPPLAPEVQTCAAGKIYPMKLDGNGAVDVPINVAY